MPTVEDLGRKVKAKHERYQHLSDIEAGRQVKLDFPGEYDHYSEVSIVRTDPAIISKAPAPIEARNNVLVKPNLPQGNVDHDLVSDIEKLTTYYSPSKGRISSWWQRGKSEGRGKLLSALTNESRQLIERAAVLEEAVRSGAKKEIEWKRFIAENEFFFLELQAREYLLQDAANRGLTIEESVKFRKKELKTGLAIDEHRERTQIDLEAERIRSGLRVDEHDRTTRISLDRLVEEKEQAVRLSLLAETMSDHQKMILVQELIDVLYKQIDDIKSGKSGISSPEVIERMLVDRDEMIQTLKDDRIERQKVLLKRLKGDGEGI